MLQNPMGWIVPVEKPFRIQWGESHPLGKRFGGSLCTTPKPPERFGDAVDTLIGHAEPLVQAVDGRTGASGRLVGLSVNP